MSVTRTPAPPPAQPQPLLSPQSSLSARSVVRVVLIIVIVAISLWLLYLLRQPLTWLFIAAFLAIALSGPVNLLQRKMPRGLAIGLVYLILLTLPFALGALFGPPLITQANSLAQNLPAYAADLTHFVDSNPTLHGLEQNFNFTSTLEEEAKTLPSKLSDAATVLSGVGVAVVSSLASIVIVLVLCAFMLVSGKGWVEAVLRAQRPDRIARLERVIDNVGRAVGNYVGGALLVGLIAGTLGFIVLLILGVPFAGPLAVLVGLASLIPLIGQLAAAVLVGIVTIFTDFPSATIAWTIYAIIYSQIENHVIQPQIQRRALNVHPFTVLVAVLFGSTLFGVLGAIIAIPAAASIQIAAREFLEYRNGEIVIDEVGEDPAPEPAADPDADADEPEGAASPDGA